MTARDQDGEVERSVLSEQVKDRLLIQENNAAALYDKLSV